MESVVIHIGFHKCASTYLQSHIFPGSEANYVFVAGYGRRILDLVQSREFDPAVFQDWVAAEIARGEGSPRDQTVLSHEELSGHPLGYAAIDPFVVADNLKRAYPRARILIVIRNQLDYLLSIYSYRVAVKGSEYRSLNRFLEEEGRLGLFAKLEYDRLIERYVALFGKEHVAVVPMELLKRDAVAFNRTVTEFLGTGGVSSDGFLVVNESTKLLFVTQLWRPVNFLFQGLVGVLEFLRIESAEEYPFMRLRYGFYGFKRRVTGGVNRWLGSSRRICMEDFSGFEDLRGRYGASNLRLKDLGFGDFGEYGYPLGEGEL